MAITYDYTCRGCGGTVTLDTNDHNPVHCNQSMKRIWGFYIKPGFQEHYNNSVDMYVPNRRILSDAMKVASEDMTNYSGVEHNFVMRDPMEYEAFGLTAEDVESQKEYQQRIDIDGRVDKGSSPFKPKPKIILPSEV